MKERSWYCYAIHQEYTSRPEEKKEGKYIEKITLGLGPRLSCGIKNN